MNKETFEQILKIYGAHHTRWPNEIKRDIKNWINIHQNELAVLKEAQQLENRLDLYQLDAPNAGIIQSVLDSIQLTDRLTLTQFFHPILPKTSIGSSNEICSTK